MRRPAFLTILLSLLLASVAIAGNALLGWNVQEKMMVSAMAFDHAGNVYLADSVMGLKKRNSRGRTDWTASLPEDVYPTHIAPDRLGNVYVLGYRWLGESRAEYVIARYDSTGKDYWWDTRLGEPNTWQYPVGLGVDDAGMVYVSVTGGSWTNFVASYGHHTFSYSPDGTLRWEHRTNFSRFGIHHSYAMTVNPLGGMVSMNSNTIEARSADGELIWTKAWADNDPVYEVRNLGFPAHSPAVSLQKIAGFDRSNNLYTAGIFYGESGANHGVRKYASDGTILWTSASESPVLDLRHQMPVDLRVDTGGNAYLGFNLPTTCGSEPFTYSCEMWPAIVKFSSTGSVEWISRLAHDGRIASDLAGIDLDEAGRCVLTARTVRYDGTGTGFLLGLFDQNGNQYPGNFYEKRSTNWTWNVWSPRFDGLGSIRVAVQRGHLSADRYIPWIARFKPYRQRGAPEIEQPPFSQTAHTGTNVDLSVAATGGGRLRYQWRRNGVAIAGATSTNLLLPAIQRNQAGDYSVEVRNLRGTVVTPDARVTVTD